MTINFSFFTCFLYNLSEIIIRNSMDLINLNSMYNIVESHHIC